MLKSFLSSDSDKLVIVFNSHLLVFSLKKIIFDEIILDSFVEFEKFLTESPPQDHKKGAQFADLTSKEGDSFALF